MPLIELKANQPNAFKSSWQSWLGKKLPIIQLLRDYIQFNNEYQMEILEEDQLPSVLHNFFTDSGFDATVPEQFFLHDRSNVRLAVVLAQIGDHQQRQSLITTLSEGVHTFLVSLGMSPSDFALVPIRRLHFLQRRFMRNVPVCVLVWQPRALFGEAPISSLLPDQFIQQISGLLDVPLKINPTQTVSRNVVVPFVPTPEEKEVPIKSIKPVGKMNSDLQLPLVFDQAILGNKKSTEIRKYYLKKTDQYLRLALLSSQVELSNTKAIHFFQTLQENTNFLKGHKENLESGVSDDWHSLSLEITRTGQFHCINQGVQVLLWRETLGKCHMIAPTVLSEKDELQVKRLKGQLNTGDGMLFLADTVSRSVLMELIRVMVDHGNTKNKITFRRALANKLDILSAGRALWIDYQSDLPLQNTSQAATSN